MKKSIAVLQPTLFEGGPGGGSIYDAVSLGVPSLVSDISVNLEINDENVTFFKAESPDDLALKMLNTYKAERKQYSREYIVKRGEERTRLLGDKLFEAIFSALP